ncbi:MAG: N-acetyltransferase family protein [Candidatus Omnitrophota bacterium]
MNKKNYEFRKLSKHYRKPVIDIFNYFIKNSFAAYPEKKVSYDFFNLFLQMAKGYPAVVVIDKNNRDKVVGFALMRAHSPMKTLARTAELTYFILPEHTGKGIGKKIIESFIRKARNQKIDSLLAGISSLNEHSINFHKKMGFKRCGRFCRVGCKLGKDFDVVWMQKLL